MTDFALALTLSEADWQRRVVDAAAALGCHVFHARPAQIRPGQWVTPMAGHPGFPDLVIARDGWVICPELKRIGGRVSPAQKRWLDALGSHGRVWFPNQWDAVLAELRHGPEAA